MTFDISLAGETDRVKWDSIVESSPFGTLFHRWDWLKIAGRYSKTRLLPLIIHEGTNDIAIYPLFILNKMGFNIALSPPSNLYIPYLGPVIKGYEEMKQARREHLLIETQNCVDRYLFADHHCKIVRIRSSPPLIDSRQFRWCGYEVEPLYTYRISLQNGLDGVWDQLDRKLRVTINRQIRDGITVERGKKEEIEYLLSGLTRRFSEQGIDTINHLPYVSELYDAFSPDHMQIWIARHGEDRVGGMISLSNNLVSSLWIGISRSSPSQISGNELVQWEAIRWACQQGHTWYEEIDAGDNPRLRQFKSKFNPKLVPWYSCRKYSSRLFRLLYSLWK